MASESDVFVRPLFSGHRLLALVEDEPEQNQRFFSNQKRDKRDKRGQAMRQR